MGHCQGFFDETARIAESLDHEKVERMVGELVALRARPARLRTFGPLEPIGARPGAAATVDFPRVADGSQILYPTRSARFADQSPSAHDKPCSSP